MLLRPWRALLVLELVGGAALADSREPAAAEQLFMDGRAAMERRDYATACARFEQSERLDPAAGTLINLAECLDRQGRAASSWLRWREALDALSPDDERRGPAQQRLAAVATRVPRLEIRLSPGASSEAVVARDGAPVDRAALG